MHRFYMPPESCGGAQVTLMGSEAHHAVSVLRVRVGEPVVVLDGVGRELRGRIEHVGKHEVGVRVEERREFPPRDVVVHLAVALLKGRAWDVVLEKATELGAASIQPLAADRCVARVADDDVPAKLAGWRTTTIAAAKQCGTTWLPDLRPPVRPASWCGQEEGKRSPGHRSLVAALEPGAVTIRSALAGTGVKSVTVIIGPEGDFTAEEYAGFRAAGAVPISLGSLVLRADTAVIAALAVAGAELASGS